MNYRAGDTQGAIDSVLRHVCGDGYRPILEAALPDTFSEALGEADLFFQVEMPAVQNWRFGQEEAASITQPVLDVLGAYSVSRFVEGSALTRSWFPHADHFVLPAAGHLLMAQNPMALAAELREYFTRHPLH
jgi:pimeloyl-ACP methyl ester carboxylesterase